jgi:hypothetical protein
MRALVRMRAFVPLGGLIALVLAVLATADHGREVLSIPIEPLSLGLASDVLPVATYEGTVRRIAHVMSHDLNLPLPGRITLHLYESPKRLAEGLVEELGVAPLLASQLSDFAAGLTVDQHLLLLEPESRRGAREWLRLVAHEMAHVSQAQLAGRQGRTEQWLAEGMADWVAYSVLDRLGVCPLAEERSLILRAARHDLAGATRALDLEALGEPRGFLDVTRRDGAATYRLAFLLTDGLIERHGFPRVVDYFRAARRPADRDESFTRAFGETPRDFARDLLATGG